jgi:hypothetical protein
MWIQCFTRRLCMGIVLVLTGLSAVAGCDPVRTEPEVSQTSSDTFTVTPATTRPAVAPTETFRVPPEDLCREYLDLSVLDGEGEAPAVATSYQCYGASIDSTGQSPSRSPDWVVHSGEPIRFQLAVEQQPTAIEVRLYPGAGNSASFQRWPEDLPTNIEAVNRSQLEPDTRFQIVPQAPPGLYSLVVKVTWGEDVDVFYAISFTLEDVTQ